MMTAAMSLSSQQQQQQQQPRSAINNNNSPVTLQEELGCSPTLSVLFGSDESKKTTRRPTTTNNNKNNNDNNNNRNNNNNNNFDKSDNNLNYYFDPLNLATDENFARYREAELKHGRLAMLSVVMVTSQNYYIDNIMMMKDNELLFNTNNNQNNNNPLSSIVTAAMEDLSTAATTTTATESNNNNAGGEETLNPFIPSLHKVLIYDSWSILDWIGFIIFCGILEVLVYVQISPKDMPGDYGWGYFGERNKGKHERSLISELENGRLAMVSILIFIVNDLFLVLDVSSHGITGNSQYDTSSSINDILNDFLSIFERWWSS